MARDWSKQRNRDLTIRAQRYAVEDEALFEEAPAPSQSKAQMRDETQALIAAYRGPIKRLPMTAALRCRSCGHRGTAQVPSGSSPSFRCSRCGSSLIAWRV